MRTVREQTGADLSACRWAEVLRIEYHRPASPTQYSQSEPHFAWLIAVICHFICFVSAIKRGWSNPTFWLRRPAEVDGGKAYPEQRETSVLLMPHAAEHLPPTATVAAQWCPRLPPCLAARARPHSGHDTIAALLTPPLPPHL